MNTLWIDKKYAGIVSNQLERFKLTSQNPYSARFRCFYCGDSQKSALKTRGNLFEHKGKIFFKCFNCGASATLNKVLYDVNPTLFKEYKLEVLKESGEPEQPGFKPQIESFGKRRADKFQPLSKLKKISQLSNDHPAKRYIARRQIPVDKHFAIYFCPKFYQWINTIIPQKFSDGALLRDGPRIVIPFIDQEGYVFGVQGRALGNTEPRYITIMFDDNKPKVFGLDTVDKSNTVYIVEGPIDSLFLPNALAFAGSDGQLDKFTNKNNSIIVMDNEPRSVEIVSKIYKYADQGYTVCIWPTTIEQKDINDMILSGIDAKQVQSIIDCNSYNGLMAKAKLSEWRKV